MTHEQVKGRVNKNEILIYIYAIPQAAGAAALHCKYAAAMPN